VLGTALTVGCVVSYVSGKAMALDTAGWSAAGQSLPDRQFDKVGWYAIGFAVGGVLGACTAFAWFRAGRRK